MADLKKSIVIVNEYTVPTPDGGSRGGSPGDYIRRYMARELATEPVAPIKYGRLDDFIQRYMAREEAVESIELPEVPVLKRKMKAAQKDAGVAFGYGSSSLSHEALVAASEDIQSHFEKGHTVMKTVLSFSDEYLKEQGLVDENFTLQRRGEYRGKLDQLKLRLAIMNGLERMGKTLYDDLRYVGVIQVDTENVHAHLAMVDAGKGHLAPDGTQRGKIGARAKSFIRRGIDTFLDEKKKVKHLSSAVGYERRNVTTFVKRWAHKQMLKESLPQFLLSTLPEDRRLWRASTNHRAMKKPNQIVREMVIEVLEKPESPMGQAMAKVQDYANQRRDREGLKPQEWRRLVETGREEIIDRAMNSVYASLRQLPEDALAVRTGMLDVMSMDYAEIAEKVHEAEEDESLINFGFKLRSFSTRVTHHEEQREQYRELAQGWEQAYEAGNAVEASRALHRFYLEEEEFHAKCAAKYRKFLSFSPPRDAWVESWEKIQSYAERMLSLESMRADGDLRKMKNPDEAEDRGFKVYGQRGGHLLALGTPGDLEKLDQRIAKMRKSYARQVRDLQVDLFSKGLELTLVHDEETGRDTPQVAPGLEYPFDITKGLDLHHMGFDFSHDVVVGETAKKYFTVTARRRADALQGALVYLEATDQHEVIEQLPVKDIASMSKLADDLEKQGSEPKLISRVAELARAREIVRRSRTIRLTEQVSERLNDVLENCAADVQIDPDQAVVLSSDSHTNEPVPAAASAETPKEQSASTAVAVKPVRRTEQVLLDISVDPNIGGADDSAARGDLG